MNTETETATQPPAPVLAHWSASSTGHRIKGFTIELTQVEYEWLHKRARRNNLEPQELARSFFLKAIALEEVRGTVEVKLGKDKEWHLTCTQPKARQVESTSFETEGPTASAESPSL